MPCGLVRTDLNKTGISFRSGISITLPLDFGNDITWLPDPAHFGNPVPPTDPSFNSNPVTWTVNPAQFGNIIGTTITTGLLQENGTNFFLLENSTTDIILLEQ